MAGEKSENAEIVHPFWCSVRFALALCLFLGNVSLYSVRINLSVAMVCMVDHAALHQHGKGNYSHLESSNGSIYGPPDQESSSESSSPASLSSLAVNESKSEESHKCATIVKKATESRRGEFVWDKKLQGLILSSFFWGYMITQFPGGYLSDRFGPKLVLGWSLFLSAASTLLMPVAARAHYGFLMAMRILCGLAGGAILPAIQTFWGRWAPAGDRAKALSITLAGTQLGMVITLPLGGWLCEAGFDGGWPAIFYILGVFGVTWSCGWMFFASDGPESHRMITKEEKEYIQRNLPVRGKKMSPPWGKILTSGPVWACIIAHTTSNWGLYTFLTNTPTYMYEVLKFDIKTNGALSALPFIGFGTVSICSGLLSDRLRRRLKTTFSLKLFNTLGSIIPAVFLIALGFLDCSQAYYAVALLALGLSGMGLMWGGGYMINFNMLTTQYSGVLFGIANTLGTVPGFVAPTIVGAITKQQTRGEWQIVLCITAGVYLFGALMYGLLASGERCQWDIDAAAKAQNKQEEQLKVPLNRSLGAPTADEEEAEVPCLRLSATLRLSHRARIWTS